MTDFSEASAQASESIDSSGAAEAAEESTQTQPAQTDTSTESSGESESSIKTYDDAMAALKKTRQEAAERRVALKTYEEAFGKYTDEDRQVWLQLANLLAQDQKAGAEAMKEIASGLLGEETTTNEGETVSNQEKGAAEQAAEAVEALTPDKVQEIVQAQLSDYQQKQAQQQSQQQKLQEIRSQAKELGYEPESPDYTTLLHFASKETEGDLKAAHEKVKEWKSGVVKSLTEQKSEKADRTASTPEASGVQPAPEKAETPKDFKQAKEKLMQFLDDQARAGAQGA